MKGLLNDLDSTAPTPSPASRSAQNTVAEHREGSTRFTSTTAPKATDVCRKGTSNGQSTTNGSSTFLNPSAGSQPSLAQLSKAAFSRPSSNRPTNTSARLPGAGPEASSGQRIISIKRERSDLARPDTSGPPPKDSSSSAFAKVRSCQSPAQRGSLAQDTDLALGDVDDWLADLDDADLVPSASKVKVESITAALTTELQGRPVKREQSSSSSGSALIKRASRTQSKLWAERAKVHQVSYVNERLGESKR